MDLKVSRIATPFANAENAEHAAPPRTPSTRDLDFEDDMKKFKADVQQERERYQPSTREKIFAMVKSLILRAIIFYFVIWLLRRNSSSRPVPDAQTPSFDDEPEDLIQDDEL